ncbi:Ap3d1 protein [Macrolepiota fuliginosa MF-IS2]|uniref:AP-3 complex subunit delta n=1 Tax=Macrolepiota fuliginosa MF-IS2 TaxID=1400762 RepID=A0A9P6CA72_9AGAR|nr:Ap3d1 protein [Macrolepiota fuliginosa MF-IS2]
MWERTLQDLIRGLRANKKDESKFIAKAVDEIRREVKGDDMELKAGAVLKLTYLDMLGYDMSWASFHVVEAMSSPRFHLKSVGYLAASQSFNEDTDVLMLTTNLLKKDLGSNPADTAVTLNGLSAIITPDLARDLTTELIAMLNHSRAQIRKRAVLAIYKVLEKYPEASSHARPRLIEKLEDPDSGVVAATVNVLCELARRNPQDYLTLAPQLFHLLTNSTNNWMLIKIIKLFGSLSPYEPRLVKKLQPPITELISTTPAISLLYECVHTCIIGGMLQGSSGDALAELCVSKLAAFIQDADQNLKYIALLAMAKIVPSRPHLVAEYQDTILASVSDQDISIRMRALDLVTAMVNRSNLQSIVQQLLSHLVPESISSLPTAAQSLARSSTVPSSLQLSSPSRSPSYRLILSQRILSICSRSTYENVTNFEWYLSVLVDLAHIANVDIGAEIRDQLVDVVGRVRAARRYTVKLMYSVLTDDSMLQNAGEEGSCSEVLWAAAWIVGEYCEELSEPERLLPYLLQPNITRLPPDTVSIYIQAAIKIFGFWASELAQRWDEDDLATIKSAVENMSERMAALVSSPHIEVQERAANIRQLCNFIFADLNSHRSKTSTLAYATTGSSTALEDTASAQDVSFPKSLYLIQPLFSTYELNPVASNAQASVPVPDGLDLDAWIVPPPQEPVVMVDNVTPEKKKKSRKGKEKEVNGNKRKTSSKKVKGLELLQDGDTLTPVDPDVESPEERERRKAERREQLRDDPYYIIDDPPPKLIEEDVESIPVVRLEDMPSIIPDSTSRRPFLRTAMQEFSSDAFVVERDGEMPGNPISRTTATATPSSGRGTPITSGSLPKPVHLSSFPPYETPDDLRTSTPEPIKVVRSKKKTAGAEKERKKKKRTANTSAPTDT